MVGIVVVFGFIFGVNAVFPAAVNPLVSTKPDQFMATVLDHFIPLIGPSSEMILGLVHDAPISVDTHTFFRRRGLPADATVQECLTDLVAILRMPLKGFFGERILGKTVLRNSARIITGNVIANFSPFRAHVSGLFRQLRLSGSALLDEIVADYALLESLPQDRGFLNEFLNDSDARALVFLYGEPLVFPRVRLRFRASVVPPLPGTVEGLLIEQAGRERCVSRTGGVGIVHGEALEGAAGASVPVAEVLVAPGLRAPGIAFYPEDRRAAAFTVAGVAGEAAESDFRDRAPLDEVEASGVSAASGLSRRHIQAAAADEGRGASSAGNEARRHVIAIVRILNALKTTKPIKFEAATRLLAEHGVVDQYEERIRTLDSETLRMIANRMSEML